jgi:hypothetical protein
MRDNIFLMKCGHVNNAQDRNGNPACVICGCFDIDKKIEKPTDGLEGRQAKCPDCGGTTESRWDLPFFKHNPDRKFDSYYCGCYGWN